MVWTEELVIYKRHCKKWRNWTGSDFKLCFASYHVDYVPRFPFVHFDRFWFRRMDHSNLVNNNKFTIDADISVPKSVCDVLEKGPRFRVPHKLNNQTISTAKMDLEVLTYKVRWQDKFKDDLSRQYFHIPFDKNTVKLPPKMSKDKEFDLSVMKNEILKVIQSESKATKASKRYKRFQSKVAVTRKFLKVNDLKAIPSDKTNRLCITESSNFMDKNYEILNDNINYRELKKSRNKSIENQANKLIKSVCGNRLSTTELQKLVTSGSSPAKFRSTIKDHKQKTEDGFPLRPIAAVNNTPTEKIDWYISNILTQLAKLVKSNVLNTNDVIANLEKVDYENNPDHCMFISLDVVNLYPSIDILYGINAVIEFATLQWDKIVNFGMSITDLEKCLKFIAFNYEISLGNKTYLQIKGCPMGSHFAPPFAIIVMDKIENQALSLLKTNNNIVPTVYVRFIDDILLGPFERNDGNCNTILQTFNSINNDIQFTMEVPKMNEPLSFLDIDIMIVDKTLKYGWHTKSTHSNITLNKNSWLPCHVKQNFIRNSVKSVNDKCSDEISRNIAFKKLNTRLKDNGFGDVDCNRVLQKKGNKLNRNNKRFTYLKLDFINDRCYNKINRIIKKYNFPIKVIMKPSKFLYQRLNVEMNSAIKHNDCKVCKLMPDGYMCNIKFLVYCFICIYCNKKYIGQTCRPFYIRYREHASSLRMKNTNSALSEHSKTDHGNNMSIDDFRIEIMKKCNSPVATRIMEAQLIESQRPQINRKNEITSW